MHCYVMFGRQPIAVVMLPSEHCAPRASHAKKYHDGVRQAHSSAEELVRGGGGLKSEPAHLARGLRSLSIVR